MRSTQWSGNEVHPNEAVFPHLPPSLYSTLTTHLDSIAIGVTDRDFEIIATVSPGASRSRRGRVALDQEKHDHQDPTQVSLPSPREERRSWIIYS